MNYISKSELIDALLKHIIETALTRHLRGNHDHELLLHDLEFSEKCLEYVRKINKDSKEEYMIAGESGIYYFITEMILSTHDKQL